MVTILFSLLCFANVKFDTKIESEKSRHLDER